MTTDRQATFIRDLLSKRRAPNAETSMESVLSEAGVTVDAFLANVTDTREASRLIDTLLSYPKVQRVSATGTGRGASSTTTSSEPPVGVHLVPSVEGGEDVVVKVQKSRGTDRTYAKTLRVILNSDGSRHSHAWDYCGRQGPFRRCTAETLITIEQAAEFGHRTGVCAVCGIELTVTESIDRGIGPVCYRNLGGSR